MYRTIRGEWKQLKNPSYDLGRYISPETPNFKVNSGVKSAKRCKRALDFIEKRSMSRNRFKSVVGMI